MADIETCTQARTFDFARHGRIASHRYRSYFEAQPGATTKCAFCGRVIRYCYAMHDQHEKTFLIGSCEFNRYRDTNQYDALIAAQTLQGYCATTSGQGVDVSVQEMEARFRGWLSSLQRRKRNGRHNR